MHGITSSVYLRQSHLVGRPFRKATATRPAREAEAGLIPISSATLWRKVRDGSFPSPVKLGPRVTAWKAADVSAWIVGVNK